MKKLLFSLAVFAVCLLLLVACGKEAAVTTDVVKDTLPYESTAASSSVKTNITTPEETVITTVAETAATTSPQSSTAATIPTLPEPLCLNDLNKMAIRPIAFEKNDTFGNSVFLTYVFNDNATEIDTAMLQGIEGKTVYAAVRVDNVLFRVDDYKRSGVYLYCNIEKAGAMLIAGVTYSVALEFYNSRNELLYYSVTELLASTLTTIKTPERTPLTVTLPEKGLSQKSVTSSSLSASSIEIASANTLSYLFDGKTSTQFSGTVQDSIPTIYFSLNRVETLTHYTFTTANNAKSYPDRIPAGWRLYGKVGDIWMLLSKVESNPTYETGLKATNSSAFSYAINNPIECLEYKIEFTFASSVMQLGNIALYATDGFSVPAPDTTSGTLLNEMTGVQASLVDFRLITNLQNHVGVAYYLSSGSSLVSQIKTGLASGDMFAAITLDKTIYQISDYTVSGDYILFDLQSAGAPVYANIQYQISLGIYKSSGERLYYTITETRASSYQTPNLPARVGANITLPQGLTEVKANANSAKTENIEHWGDGAPAQFFDGNPDTTKIGGYVANGEFTLTFKLNSAATLTYYTFYTGNDTATHPDRNPSGWILYGKVGNEYVVLSDVRENSVTVSGLQTVDATPYSYRIENPQNCSEYMIVFYTDSMFQLNEMVLYKNK